MNSKQKIILFTLILIISITINNSISEIQAKTKKLNIEAQNLEAYWDKECSIKVSKINWDKINPGETKYICIYLKNVGDEFVFPQIEIINWNPITASKYISISTKFSCKKIKPNTICELNINLYICEEINGINNFTFDITISTKSNNGK
jgi:hypothetical protein